MVERIHDIFQLQGHVGNGIINKVIFAGGIPANGTGSYSVPRALRQIEKSERNGHATPQTKKDRRDWNLSHRMPR